MQILSNTIRNYAWGSRTALAELGGRSPGCEPEAELWMGAHEAAPSRVAVDGQERGLDELIRANPAAALGPACVEAFGERLPFLLKVLAAAAPLSIQVHPDRARAGVGFRREGALGLPADHPRRSYRDANHKPELICALGEFHALCGFRPLSHTVALIAQLAVPELQPLAERLSRGGAPALKRAVAGFFEASRSERAVLIGALAAGASRLGAVSAFSAEARWLPRLAREYPDDPGVLTAMMMNHVVLGRGEAIYVRPRTLHAYLEGTGIELMASSDNVIRGGLTPKHIDVPELLSLTEFEPAPTIPLSPSSEDGTEQVFSVPAPELRLSRLSLAEGARWLGRRGGPDILLCVEGAVGVSVRSGPGRLTRGASAFIPFDDGTIELAGGPATVFRATVAL